MPRLTCGLGGPTILTNLLALVQRCGRPSARWSPCAAALVLLAVGAPSAAQEVVLSVEITDSGARVVDAVLLDGEVLPASRSSTGAVRVLGAEDAVLGRAGWSEGARLRSVITPDGGEAAIMRDAHLLIRASWPAGSAVLELDGQRVTPRPWQAWPPPKAVQRSGPPDRRLDLLLLAEGFTEGDEGAFDVAVARVVSELGTMEPWRSYRGLLNIWSLFVPSERDGVIEDLELGVASAEGSDAPPASDEPASPFDCAFGCGGIDWLICCDEEAIVRTVVQRAPFADGVLLLVNSERYGGSGGFTYATAATGPDLERLATHELGHTLIDLWDEYDYGIDGFDDEAPNCGHPDDPLPWEHWLDEPGVGVYPSCSFSNWVRPTARDCIMRTLSVGHYCPVCREHAVRRLLEAVGGLRGGVDPLAGEPVRVSAGEVRTFAVATNLDPSLLRYVWTLDGEEVGRDPTFALDGCAGVEGELAMQVSLADGWLRRDPSELGVLRRRWPVQTDRCAGCGCGAVAPPPWPGWLALPGLIALRRRRA